MRHVGVALTGLESESECAYHHCVQAAVTDGVMAIQ